MIIVDENKYFQSFAINYFSIMSVSYCFIHEDLTESHLDLRDWKRNLELFDLPLQRA